jgi:hypothetical protein
LKGSCSIGARILAAFSNMLKNSPGRFEYIRRNWISISNQRKKIIATENTEITEDFFSVLSVADI